MFDHRFTQTRLGKAAVFSVAIMAAFVALSSQMHATPAYAAAACPIVELA